MMGCEGVGRRCCGQQIRSLCSSRNIGDTWLRRYSSGDLTTLESRSRLPRRLRQPSWSTALEQAPRSRPRRDLSTDTQRPYHRNKDPLLPGTRIRRHVRSSAKIRSGSLQRTSPAAAPLSAVSAFGRWRKTPPRGVVPNAIISIARVISPRRVERVDNRAERVLFGSLFHSCVLIATTPQGFGTVLLKVSTDGVEAATCTRSE